MSSQTTSIYKLQAQLLGMNEKDFKNKMKPLVELIHNETIQGKQITMPNIFRITTATRSYNTPKLLLSNKNMTSAETTRMVMTASLHRSFKDLFKEMQAKHTTNLF